jgi:hypothetical protein
MKKSSLYYLFALAMVMSLMFTSGCGQAAAPAKAPAASASPVAPTVPTPVASTIPAAAPVAGYPDLAITNVQLEGKMVIYKIKNVGTADSPQTYAYLYVNDQNPAQGGSSFVDVLKPGEERLATFSNYGWPYGNNFGAVVPFIGIDSRGYIELPLNNYNLKVTADGSNVAAESNETNNSRMTVVGMVWDYDLLSVASLAIWRNAEGDVPEPGSENDIHGAHILIPNADMEVRPQLETMPQQVPQGWMQGIWGYFYSDDYGSHRTAAIQLPAKLHFQARVGLASYATGSDGVTFRFGLKDLNDTVTWIASKKMTSPGTFEKWDVNLGDYAGQKCYFIMRVDGGASTANDFAIWKEARLLQVND